MDPMMEVFSEQFSACRKYIADKYGLLVIKCYNNEKCTLTYGFDVEEEYVRIDKGGRTPFDSISVFPLTGKEMLKDGFLLEDDVYVEHPAVEEVMAYVKGFTKYDSFIITKFKYEEGIHEVLGSHTISLKDFEGIELEGFENCNVITIDMIDPLYKEEEEEEKRGIDEVDKS